MKGARHATDETCSEAGATDTPYSFGPNLMTLALRAQANAASKEMDRTSINGEPKPGKELDFN